MLTDEQFDRTRWLAMQLAGIALHDRHREVLQRRCRRMDFRGAGGLDALLNAAETGDPDAGRMLVDLVTTKFTGFFRQSRQLETAAQHALEASGRHGRATLWSAATATGEEAYSLAIAVVEQFERDDPSVEIFATDINEDALEAARRGEYRDAALERLDDGRRNRFFTATGAGTWIVAPALRKLVTFRRLNLIEPTWTVKGPLDVVLCRNVLIYLDEANRGPILERAASLLRPEGLLILDPVEHPGSAARLFTRGLGGVYERGC